MAVSFLPAMDNIHSQVQMGREIGWNELLCWWTDSHEDLRRTPPFVFVVKLGLSLFANYLGHRLIIKSFPQNSVFWSSWRSPSPSVLLTQPNIQLASLKLFPRLTCDLLGNVLDGNECFFSMVGHAAHQYVLLGLSQTLTIGVNETAKYLATLEK